MSIEVGQVIDGKYRVAKLLGQGGMGAVYLAEHMVIGRRVALKVLLGSVAGNETAVARFEREVQAAGRIGNDHILEISTLARCRAARATWSANISKAKPWRHGSRASSA